MAIPQRTRAYDVPAALAVLNEILKMELATVVYYTHYSFMVYGHARIPVIGWMRSHDEWGMQRPPCDPSHEFGLFPDVVFGEFGTPLFHHRAVELDRWLLIRR